MPSTSTVVAAVAGAVGFAVYYLNHIRHKPRLSFHPESGLAQHLLAEMPSLTSHYYPTFWALDGHSQTVFGVLLRTNPDVEYRREYIPTGDGGQVGLDWHDIPQQTASTPLILVLHGLTGGSNENYVKHIVLESEAKGWRSVVFNYRGCGGTVATTPRGYSAAFTHDLDVVVKHIHQTLPGAPLFAIGVSLGSMILTKYLGEKGTDTHILGGVSVSNPWDVFISSASLESFPSRYLYNRRLTNNLKNLIFRHEHLFNTDEGRFLDLSAIGKLGTIREFDRHVIVPMFGFETVNDYYNVATSVAHLPNVKIPLLCLNAADDPFSPEHGIPHHLFQQNPNVLLCLTKKGGHIGFAQSQFPPFKKSLIEVVLTEFVSSLLKRSAASASASAATATDA